MNKMLFVLLYAFFIPLNIFCQSDPLLEVIAMFEPGIISFPEGKSEATTVDATITIKQIENSFYQNDVVSIEKAFPQFSSENASAVSRTGEFVNLIDISNIFIMTVSNTDKVQSLINSLKGIQRVIYAEPNFHNYRNQGFPNDDHFQNGDQWGLHNYGQNGGTVNADIDAPEAWDITTGSNVLVAVIDDGVYASHEDLTNKVSGDAGVYGGNQYWEFGHGTHVAGIIAATGNNTVGIAGVNWAATVNSQRIENGSDSHIYNSIMDAANAGALIFNNSWGGEAYSTTIRLAFANIYKLNLIPVAAMGNANTSSLFYPAGYGQGIISVGASDRNDDRSLWIYGRGSNYGNHIDVVAPGTSIWSTFPYTNGYVSWNGTSMATPFVSGLASLLLSELPSLYNDDIEQIIRISADDKGDPGFDIYYGTGRVNVYNALKLLQYPYYLNHISASGGTDYFSSGEEIMQIFGASGLVPGGYYRVVRHEVRKTVTFPYRYDHYVWGRGVGTVGWSLENPNYAMGFCEAVDGTITSSQATLRTYVYEVRYLSGGWIGWYPTTPQNVSFNYTVLGKVMISPIIDDLIPSPDPFCQNRTNVLTCVLSQGSGPKEYIWWDADKPSNVNINYSGNKAYVTYTSSENMGEDAPQFSIYCKVKIGPYYSNIASHFVTSTTSCSSCPTLAFELNGELVDENPLLITSLSNPGIDVTDYYLINTEIEPVGDEIKFSIHEPQTEHTWLDYVELIEAKVKSDELVAVNDEGEVINYKKTTAPVRVMLNDTTNITEILAELDTLDISLSEGDVLTIYREELLYGDDDDGDMVLSGEEPITKEESFRISLAGKKDSDGGIKNNEVENPPLGGLFFRTNRSIVAKSLRNLPPGNLEITISKNLVMDYLVLVKNKKTAKITTLDLLSATHNQSGDVKDLLFDIDQNYVEIYPGEIIDFIFQKGNTPGEKTAYILKSVGRYETDSSSIMLKDKNLTGTGNEIIIPLENKLFDNYPNPFNPVTQIQYSIKENSPVSLKVYDILGNEVAVLVNKEQPAGNYTVHFDASNLSSGIYFYTITAKDFHQTKKMLLIK